MTDTEGRAQLIVAGGCFWCTEAVFGRVRGVTRVESGYIGGHVDQPTYRQVCTGTTGHAEAVRISYNPSVVGPDVLLDIFFATHDPTQLNGQGNDIGTQYRSAIFPLDAGQEQAARAAMARAQQDHARPIVTTIEDAAQFWPAEAEHDDYFTRVGDANPYCTFVIAPKVKKLLQHFPDRAEQR